MFDAITDNLPYIAGGYWVTFKLTLLSLAGGLPLGILVGLGRISRKKWIYFPVTFYVNVIRNIPLILVIFWFYFVMPIIAGKPLDPFITAVISFILFEATYFGEIIRAGYQSVSKGQIEAGYSTGLTNVQTTRYILIPVALRRMLPSLITQTIITYQDSCLAFVIGLPEFMRRVVIVDTVEIRSIQLYGLIAVVFLSTCYLGSVISQRFEVKKEKGA